jgi:hypothetical protein
MRGQLLGTVDLPGYWNYRFQPPKREWPFGTAGATTVSRNGKVNARSDDPVTESGR